MRRINLILLFLLSLPAYASLELESFLAIQEESYSTASSPVILRRSPYSFNKTVANLKKAITGRNFKIIRIQHLDQGFVKKENESKDLIIYFCNFGLIHEGLQSDKRIGRFLPCRITILERKGQVYLITTNPKVIGKLLNNTSLRRICNSVLDMYNDIMDEVTI